MFDFKFDWQKELNTGIESIDVQHKQLFKIGRDMEQLLRIQCIGVTDKQLLDIVCELRDFTGYHFYAEESMMNEMCYPGITAHKKVHKEYSDYVMKIDMPKLKASPVKELKVLRDEVQAWIMDHVLKEDMKMAKAYVQYQQQQENRPINDGVPMEEKFGRYLATFDVTKFYLYKDQTCKGRVVAVFKESARELCKLSALERNMFFADIAKAAKSLKKLYEPEAICYLDSEDMNERLVFHIIPKYKENGTYGVPQPLDKPPVKTESEVYDRVFEEVKKAFE